MSEQDKSDAVRIILEAAENGCRLKIACADLEISFNTFLSWRDDPVDKRKGPLTAPANKLSQEICNKVIGIATSHEFMDESPWVIVAKLADRGEYLASESSFYKILREHQLLAHRGKSRPQSRKRPSPLVASGPCEIWSWDITYMKTSVTGIFYYLYMFVDIYSRKIVGFDVFESESMENSSLVLKRACISENVQKSQLTLHSDNGAPMKGATMLSTMQALGVIPSFSRPRVSDDNPYSEALFKTVKYHHRYPGHFENIAAAKSWVIGFVNWYNEEHLHSGIKFVTPTQRHQGNDIAILANRKSVYQKARMLYPERWNGRKIKSFDHKKEVFLNYLQKEKADVIKRAS